MHARALSAGLLFTALAALLVPVGLVPLANATTPAPVESVSATAGSVLVPLLPKRAASTSVPARGTVTVPVTGVAGVPTTGVAAVTLSVTASLPKATGSLTLFPAGASRPGVTSLSFPAGASRTGTVVVPPGSGGHVAVHNASSAAVTVTLDAQAWAAAPGTTTTGSTYVPLNGTRVLSTRTGTGGAGTSAVAPGTAVSVKVLGAGGVPATSVSSVTLAVTALQPAAAGSVTAYPAGARRPPTAAVSFPKGRTSTSLVTVRPGAGGQVSLHNASRGTTHLLADVVGYTRPAGISAGSTFVPVRPTRIVNTATSLGTSGPVAARATATFPALGVGPLPRTGVSAVLLSLTARSPGAAGQLTAYPTGARRPGVWHASFAAGKSETQLVVVRPGSLGKVSVYNGSAGGVQLQADVIGYFGPDTTAPAAVGSPAATTTTSSARLTWTNSTTPDFAAVVVRREVGSTPPASITQGTLAATVRRTSSGYTDRSLTGGTTYSWSMFAIDGARNAAPVASATATTGLDPVTSTTATPGLDSVALSWTNPTGEALRGVLIRRASGSTPPASPTAGEPAGEMAAPGTSWTDSGLTPSTTYSYALFAHDGAGRYSAPATVSTTTTPDTIPPDPVSGLAAAPSGDGLRLSWTNPADLDLAGVEIRRLAGTTPPSSPTSGTLVARPSAPASSFLDASVSPRTTYSYSVFARDDAGNHSAGTSTTAQAPADTTAPRPVTELTAGPSGDGVQLSWKNPSDPDLAGVDIRRFTGTTPPSTPTEGTYVGSAVAPASGFFDGSVVHGRTYSYAVFARDTSGNRSAATSATTAAPPDTEPPNRVSGLTVHPYGVGLRLSWTNPSNHDLAGVEVRRLAGTTAPSSPSSGTHVGSPNAPATSIIDESVTPGQTYSYSVFARDDASNHSAATPVTTTAPTEPGPVEVCGRVTTDQTWSPQRASAYVLTCTVTVDPRVTLTLAPGVVVKAAKPGTSYYSDNPGIVVKGTLTGAGTADDPIVMTSLHDDSVGGDTGRNGAQTSPGRGDWAGIKASPVDGATPPVIRLSEAQISFGLRVEATGSTTFELARNLIREMADTAVYAQPGPHGSVVVEGNTVRDVTGSGIDVRAAAVTPVVRDNTVQRVARRAVQVYSGRLDPAALTGNTGSGNQVDALVVSGTLAADLTLPMAGLPWVVGIPLYHYDYYLQHHQGELVVPPRTTLTLGPGAVLKLAPVPSCTACDPTQLRVQGTLRAVGTEASPAVLTSLRDDTHGGDTNADGGGTRPLPGDWGMVTSSPVDGAPPPAIELDHAVVSYGRQVASNGTTALDVRRSTLAHMSDTALAARYARGGSVVVSGNRIDATARDGINVIGDASGAPTVEGNTVTRVAGRAIAVFGRALRPAQLLGNTGSDNQASVIDITGTIVGDLTLPTPGLSWSVTGISGSGSSAELVVAPGAALRLGPGAVLKLGAFCKTGFSYACSTPNLVVAGTLEARGTVDRPAVLTSMPDDTAGGDTNGDGGGRLPSRSDWGSVQITPLAGSPAPTVVLARTQVRYGRGVTGNGPASLTVTDSRLERLAGSAVNTVNVLGPDLLIERNRIDDVDNHGIAIWARVGEKVGPTVSDNEVTRAKGSAISVRGDHVVPAQIQRNTGSDNHRDVVSVSGTLGADLTLPVAGLPWAVGGPLTVGVGATLALGPNAVLKLNDCPYYTLDCPSLRIAGALRATGTESSPAHITSIRDDTVGGDDNGDGNGSTPRAGDWSLISAFQATGAPVPVVDLDHAVIRYGRSLSSAGITSFTVTRSRIADMQGTAVSAQQAKGGTVTLEGNTVERAGGDGIIAVMDAADTTNAPTVRNNSVLGTAGRAVQVAGSHLLPELLLGNTGADNVLDVMEVSGTLAGDLTLPTPGLAWVVGRAASPSYSTRADGTLTVGPHASLTMLAGAVLKFEDGCRAVATTGCGSLRVSGTLRSSGTDLAPAVFTSLRDDAAGGDANRDGGASVPAAADWGTIAVVPVELAPAPVVDLQEAAVRYATTALTVPSGDSRITGTIEHDGFGIAGPPKDESGGCATGVVTAKDVYWGSPTGPAPYGTGPGVSGCVDVEPWRATPLGGPVTSPATSSG